MAGDREKSLAAGCNDYDTKPIDFRRLVEKIQGFLSKETT
jgi:CheY-like chemotaxis protein